MSNHPNELPRVAIIMGSDSDWPTLKSAAEVCSGFEIPWEAHVVSAHRSPQEMVRFATGARGRGIEVIVAGAGGAAHLPGMVASLTTLPVIGVPVESRSLKGIDSLLSIVQMPAGVPVATVSIGGGGNAGLLAMRILSLGDERLAITLARHLEELAVKASQQDERLQSEVRTLKQAR